MASLRPSAAMREAAAKGLKLREQFGRGGLSTRQAAEQGVGSGVQRAVNIARGDELPLETWKRVKSYFDRHQGDKDAKGSPSRGYWGDDSNPSAGYVAWLLWGSDAGWEQARQVLKTKNPGGWAMGLFDRIRRKQKQTFEEACYRRKPPGLRPRQTVVVDNEGRYFLVSENTPEHQQEAGYREVLVFPSDSAGEVTSWSEVGGRRNVDFVTFLTDLLEGRETLHKPWLKEEDGMRRNPSRARLPLAGFGGPSDSAEIVLYGKPVGPFQRSAIADKGGPDPDPSDALSITHLPTGMGVPPPSHVSRQYHNTTPWGPLRNVRAVMRAFALRWGALSERERRMLSEGYTFKLDRLAYDGMSEDQLDALRDFVYGAVEEQEGARRNPAYSIFDDLPDYEVELPRRSRSSSYSGPNRGAFQLRSEHGHTASFATKREAEEWADDNLPSGCYFTITSRATDTLYEYEKE